MFKFILLTEVCLNLFFKSDGPYGGLANARVGWTPQGSRTLLSATTLTPAPGTGGTVGTVATISAAQAHTDSHRRLKSLRAQLKKAPISEKTKALFQRNAKMMQNEDLATQLPTYRRPVKFTPERVQQIRKLVEQGKSREEIAELIGVTVRSLKVTCSRLAISVRRPDSSHPSPAAGL